MIFRKDSAFLLAAYKKAITPMELQRMKARLSVASVYHPTPPAIPPLSLILAPNPENEPHRADHEKDGRMWLWGTGHRMIGPRNVFGGYSDQRR